MLQSYSNMYSAFVSLEHLNSINLWSIFPAMITFPFLYTSSSCSWLCFLYTYHCSSLNYHLFIWTYSCYVQMPQLIIHRYNLPRDIFPEPSGLSYQDRAHFMPGHLCAPSSSSMSWIQFPWSYIFYLLGIFLCFYRAWLLIESLKRVHIWKALNLSCYLTKNLVDV